MIFNINELSEKIHKAKRRKSSANERPAKHHIPSLAISQKPSRAKKASKIFEIVKSGQDKRKKIAKIIVGNYPLNKSSSKILLALLYWSSGSKYPSSNFVAFSNSDQNLVKTFLNLLRRTFDIDESKIKIHLQLYTTHDVKKMVQFWSELLRVPQEQFYKPTVTKPARKIFHPNYFGTCTIRYYSLDLLLTIMGIYEQLANAI